VGHSDEVERRPWDLLLVGGASGTGKSRVASRLAHHFAIGMGAVDDFQIVLEHMTTPDQQPVIHFWRTHPDPDRLSAKEIMRQGLEVARVMSSGLEAVIADHLRMNVPVVLEGDFIAPALAAQTSFGGEPNDGRVRAVFLYEPDEGQILRNFSDREPEAGAQSKRARVSWLQGQWLESECEERRIPILAAQPWETLFDRILEALL
jgi:2-phosphoglycerate kinase